MKKTFARLVPTLPASVAAAIGVSLSLVLLHGVGVQGEATPLLPAAGGAAGRVPANLPAPTKKRAAQPLRKSVASTRPTAEASVHIQSPQRTPVATVVVRRTPVAPVRVTAPPAPAVPGTPGPPVSHPGKAKGKTRDHGRGHPVKTIAGAPAPPAPGHDGHHGKGPKGSKKSDA